MSQRKYSLESHTMRIHPKLWAWAVERAETQKYTGGASAYISALILYDRAINRPHWVTRDVMNNPGELDSVLEEIERDNPLSEHGTWFERCVKQLAAQNEGGIEPAPTTGKTPKPKSAKNSRPAGSKKTRSTASK